MTLLCDLPCPCKLCGAALPAPRHHNRIYCVTCVPDVRREQRREWRHSPAGKESRRQRNDRRSREKVGRVCREFRRSDADVRTWSRSNNYCQACDRSRYRNGLCPVHERVLRAENGRSGGAIRCPGDSCQIVKEPR